MLAEVSIRTSGLQLAGQCCWITSLARCSVMYGMLSLQRALPQMPFLVGTALFAGIMTFLNLRGIRATARTNQVLLGVCSGATYKRIPAELVLPDPATY